MGKEFLWEEKHEGVLGKKGILVSTYRFHSYFAFICLANRGQGCSGLSQPRYRVIVDSRPGAGTNDGPRDGALYYQVFERGFPGGQGWKYQDQESARWPGNTGPHGHL